MPLEIADDYRETDFARAQTGLLFNLPVPPADYEQLPAGISLCMIVKNEERFLAECLRSVQGCVDEIIIVDTGSTDRTVEIAREFGARVEHREWRHDFAWARNEALVLATRRWTLVLDADEEITPESRPLLRALRETPAHLTGVYLQIRNVVEDETGDAASMTHQLARAFPTSPRLRYRNVIHESVSLDGSEEFPAVVSPIGILHKGYTREMLAGRNKDERNRALVKRAVAEQGDSAFSWFNFGVTALASGDIDVGIDALNKMFDFPQPSRAYYGVAYTQLAMAYADAKHDYEQALATIDRGLVDVPEYPSLLFTRGYVLSLQEKYEQAREWFGKSIDVTPDSRRHFMIDDEIRLWKAPVNIANTYLKQGRPDAAVEWFELALRNKPNSPTLRNVTASAYEKTGRHYDAERLLREGSDGGDAAAVIAYVNFLLRRGRFEDAFGLLDRRAADVPADTYVTLLLDAARRSQSAQPAQAERYARRALELAPGDGMALAFLEELYAAAHRQGDRDALRRAEMDAPMRAAADFGRRSHRLLEEQHYDRALEVAEAGLAAWPGEDVLRYNAGLAAARLGDDARARTHLEAVGAHSHVATAACALRAEVARRGGDLDGAVLALTQARELQGRDEALLRTAAVSLATALIEAGRLDAAGKLAELVLA